MGKTYKDYVEKAPYGKRPHRPAGNRPEHGSSGAARRIASCRLSRSALLRQELAEE
ncbi:hypothetical protein KH017_06620 [bacterium]|uniref:hypothetical protein n=1 Tax=Victivallis lenta TaxID=2606640 RepID=UPI0012B416B8|nr:hypothetical protein [Victivallis lenta]MBS5530443.1 hypothetical protein [bacterium]